jgi:hypothetical protein
MLAYGVSLDQNLLARVPHRQYVFALPKLLLALPPRRAP